MKGWAVLPLIVLVTQWFRRNARHSYRQVRGWIARINAFLQENITGMATVQLFRREALHFDRFDAINQGHRDANIAGVPVDSPCHQLSLNLSNRFQISPGA